MTRHDTLTRGRESLESRLREARLPLAWVQVGVQLCAVRSMLPACLFAACCDATASCTTTACFAVLLVAACRGMDRGIRFHGSVTCAGLPFAPLSLVVGCCTRARSC